MDISIKTGTGQCFREISNKIGIYLGKSISVPIGVAYKNLSADQKEIVDYCEKDLPGLQALILDSKGNASITANRNILAAGDVAIQWCFTCHISPHILICGGYNSDGNATFYAHNSPLGNKTYNFKSNSQHKATCIIGAKVIQFNKCSHTYDNSGYCTKSEAVYPISITEIVGTFFAVKNDVPVRTRPYQSGSIARTLKKDEFVSASGMGYNSVGNLMGYNSVGNLWYKLSGTEERWVFSDNLGMPLDICKDPSYNSSGYCTNCLKEYQINITAMSATNIMR